jgi:hypothetical protein
MDYSLWIYIIAKYITPYGERCFAVELMGVQGRSMTLEAAEKRLRKG